MTRRCGYVVVFRALLATADRAHCAPSSAQALRGVAAMTSPITQAALNPLVLAMVRLGLGRILALPAQLLIHFISQIHNEIRCLYF